MTERDEIAACFEAVCAHVRARDWRAIYEGYDPAKAELFLAAAALAAECHVADGGDGKAELEAIRQRDGGRPDGADGRRWPEGVRDKPALFDELMRFSERHGNHHAALPLVDWERVTLADVALAPDGRATGVLVAGDHRTELAFARVDGRWRWSFAGEGAQLWGDHPPGECEGPAETPEGEIELAENALAAGDLAHAARHVAVALAADPARREWRAMLDAIADRAEDPRRLFDVARKGGAWFGEIAAHAHVLAHVGDTQKAIDTVAQTAAFAPRQGYTTWAAEWVARHRGPLDPGHILRAFGEVCGSTVGFLRLRASERALFERWAPLAQALVERPASDPLRPKTLMFASGILRRAGLLADAARAAKLSLELEPSDMAASALGLALRASRKWDEALAAFRRGEELDPRAPFAAERVRVLVDMGRLAEAQRELDPKDRAELLVMAGWLERKLGPAPRKAGLLGRLFGRDDEKRPAIYERMAAAMPESCDADAFRGLTVHAVPEIPLPTDATSNMVRQIHGNQELKRKLAGSDHPMRVTIDGLEAPSGRLAFVLEVGCATTDFSKLVYRVRAVQTPDPRLPRRPVRDVIWIYHGEDKLEVRQVLPPPGERVGRVLGELAASPWYLPAWWERARAAGRELGPSSVDEILGAMIHPPCVPETMDAVEWVFRHQLAGAFLLAHVDGGWAGSRRREVLFSLVDGVMDWTADAAILALRELALDEPEALGEIEERFWTLREEVPKTGHSWFLAMLARSYLRLPGTHAERRQAFGAIVESFAGSRRTE